MQFLPFSSYPLLRKAQPFGKQPEPQEPAFADSSGRYDGLVCIWENLASMCWSCKFFRLTVLDGWGLVLHPSLPVPLPIVWKPSVGTFSLDAGSFLRLACCCASVLLGTRASQGPWALTNKSLNAKQQQKSCFLRRESLASSTQC